MVASSGGSDAIADKSSVGSRIDDKGETTITSLVSASESKVDSDSTDSTPGAPSVDTFSRS